MEDFNNYYTGKHKTHKLSWAYGLGNLKIETQYLKKKYQPVCTLTQYCILLNLEKYVTITIAAISELLGFDQAIVANEASALLYHMSFNPKRVKTQGIITANSTDNLDLKPEHEITINKDFFANNLNLNTIPIKVIVK
jgi:hypothetical protein